MTPLIRVRGLRKAFGSLQVLSGVDTDFPEEKSAPWSPEPHRKSVSSRAHRLLKPDAGHVWFRTWS
jgi:ABC-type transporter Mla maintaining outer membrane lipid asymmetry ATPase subunit MlaF